MFGGAVDANISGDRLLHLFSAYDCLEDLKGDSNDLRVS
jgi:hypothetical protein